MKKKSNILWLILAAAIVVVAFFWMNNGLEHIEDTNGPEDFSLQTITDENIINEDMGALNVKSSTGLLSDGVTFSSDKFTGVYRIMLTNFILPSDFDLDVTNFQVNSGNFKMAVVNEGKIVAVIEPDMFASCRLEGLTGTTSLVFAGESADFSFYLDRLFCEQYDISVGD